MTFRDSRPTPSTSSSSWKATTSGRGGRPTSSDSRPPWPTPMRALLDLLEPEFGAFKVFRMNRDVRFSADKSPYKTAHAASPSSDGATPLRADQRHRLVRRRRHVPHGARPTRALPRRGRRRPQRRRARGGDRVGPRVPRLDIGGVEPPLATAPRGWPKDHPRVELLRMKGLITLRDLGAPAWLHTRRAANEVAKVWRAGAPVSNWLDANVGPSEEPPRSR